jgi:hypothetical protein
MVNLKNLTDMELIGLWNDMIGEKGREGDRIHENIPDHFNHWFNESTPWEMAWMVETGLYSTDDNFFTLSEIGDDLISFNSLDDFKCPFDMNELKEWLEKQ